MYMDCDDCVERLYPYLDRELSATEVEEVHRHLDACQGCTSAFVLERVFLDRLTASATSAVAPPDVRDRLILRIRRDVGPAPKGIDR